MNCINRFLRHATLLIFGLVAAIGLAGGANNVNVAPSTSSANQPIIFVGTYTQKLDFVNGHAKGIAAFRMDLATGKLRFLTENTGITNPSFLTIHPNRQYLYAVVDEAKGGKIDAFAVDAKSGKLKLLNQQPSHGGAPCFVTTDKTGKLVLITNYLDSNVVAYPIGIDGKLAPASSNIQLNGSGPNLARQEAAHAHSAFVDPTNHYVLVSDLGADKIIIYRLDLKTNQLHPHATASVTPGAGPRHLDFHPNGKNIYAISELDSSVYVFKWNSKRGKMKAIQAISTLPNGFSGLKSGAAIHVHPSGKFVYGSNRGDNSMVIYAVDQKNGKLSLLGFESTRGKTPRDFIIDPTGNYLLVANQDSDNIVTYRIDQQSGKLIYLANTKTPTPVCLKFLV